MAVFTLGERKVVFQGEEWFVADNATVIGSVVVHDQASVWFNAVVRGDDDIITLGERTNIQDAAVLHADSGAPLTLGKNVSVGHQAMLHGCTVGDGTLVGIGAIVLNHAVIGKACLIGAGALLAGESASGFKPRALTRALERFFTTQLEGHERAPA